MSRPSSQFLAALEVEEPSVATDFAFLVCRDFVFLVNEGILEFFDSLY